MNRIRLTAPLFVLWLLASATAWAQAPEPPSDVSNANRAMARELTIQGYAALDRREFATAADLFGRAEALFHAPTVGLGLARAYAGLGKLLAAQEYYYQVAHEPVPPDAPEMVVRAGEDARRELSALAGRIPGIIIRVTGAAAPVVTVDGAQIPNASLGMRRV